MDVCLVCHFQYRKTAKAFRRILFVLRWVNIGYPNAIVNAGIWSALSLYSCLASGTQKTLFGGSLDRLNRRKRASYGLGSTCVVYVSPMGHATKSSNKTEATWKPPYLPKRDTVKIEYFLDVVCYWWKTCFDERKSLGKLPRLTIQEHTPFYCSFTRGRPHGWIKHWKLQMLEF